MPQNVNLLEDGVFAEVVKADWVIGLRVGLNPGDRNLHIKVNFGNRPVWGKCLVKMRAEAGAMCLEAKGC